MKKSVLFNTCVSAFAALLISLTGCNNLTFTDSFDAASDFGARAVSSGSQPNHYVEVKATSTSGWEQTNKFQFKLSNLSIGSGKTVSFQIYTPENASKLTVRGVNSGSKWIKDVSVSGNNWYSVSATTTESETEIGITLYCTAKSGLKVRIGDLKVGDTWVAASSLKGNVKEYYASPKSFSVSTNDSGTTTPPPSTGDLNWAGFRFSDYGIIDDDTSYSYYSDRNSIPNKYQLPVYKSEDSSRSWEQNLSVLKKASGAEKAAIIYIVGTVHSSGITTCSKCKNQGDGYHDQADDICRFEFSRPSGVSSSSKIEYKGYDSYCDKLMKFCNDNNIDVWLQVEPGYNDPITLAKIVLNRFKSNKCVKGFGLDNEWWERHSEHSKDEDGVYHPKGKKLTDDYAEKLVAAVKNINSNYRVFAKHWETDFMPPTYRDGMVFVTDSQQYSSLNTFQKWADKFKGYPIVFQVGYPADKKFWNDKEKQFIKDLVDIGKTAKSEFGIVWVDFTMKEFVKDCK